MMNTLFVAMVVLALVFGAFTGQMSAVSAAVLGEGAKAVELVLALTGSLCLWSGTMEVAKRCGLTNRLAEIFSPLIAWLFPTLRPKGTAAGAIALNLTANFLGLGNAVTPLGIAAMQAIEKEEHGGEMASDNLILFVVLNTASLQLIPTTTALLRLQAGSVAPMEIVTCCWLASLTSVVAGVTVAKTLAKRKAGAPWQSR